MLTPEDVDTTADDHLYDCGRYGLMAAHWLDALKRPAPRSLRVTSGGRGRR